MRHLHYAGAKATVCGMWRAGIFTDGAPSNARGSVMGTASVHFTKARKADCQTCRALVRMQVWKQRAKSLEKRLNPPAPVVPLADKAAERTRQAQAWFHTKQGRGR